MRIVAIVLLALFLNSCAKPELNMPPMMLAAASAQEAKKVKQPQKQEKPKGNKKTVQLSAPNVMDYIKRKPNFRLKKVAFSNLPGWQTDAHEEAFKAFMISCKRIIRSSVGRSLGEARRPKHVYTACKIAASYNRALDRATAKKFFETYFVPHQVNVNKRGLLTGYYEPEILGSMVKTDKFKYPVYKKPKDLVQLRTRTGIGRKLGGLSAGRKTASGIRPYPTRKEIDQGALKGKGLELLYLADPIDLFFLHIQGSGRIRLTDGRVIRIGFKAKNGYPYTSIGKYMIKKRYVPKDGMSLDAVKRYLRKNVNIRDEILWVNKSYIFFRKLKNRESKLGGPMGAMQVPLTAGRSLAVDTRYHQLGMPIYVVAPSMRHHGQNGFRRLMIAQDVGSAIKGSERGDIFWGTGEAAGKVAGSTHSPSSYYVLLPKRM